jgi:hypothetical protein
MIIAKDAPKRLLAKYGPVKVGKNLHTLQLILFSKITAAFLFRTFGGFLHVPTTHIYCLTDAIISETRITNIFKYYVLSSTVMVLMLADPLQGQVGGGLGPGNRDFFGPCEVASSR